MSNRTPTDEIRRYAETHSAGYGMESRLAQAYLALAAAPLQGESSPPSENLDDWYCDGFGCGYVNSSVRIRCRACKKLRPAAPIPGERRDDEAASVEHPLIAECGMTRDLLGELVRDAWVRWAKKQPAPKPHWLAPWSELGESDREADRQIGQAVALLTIAHWTAHAASHRETRDEAPWLLTMVKPCAWRLVSVGGYAHRLQDDGEDIAQKDLAQFNAAGRGDDFRIDALYSGEEIAKIAKLAARATPVKEPR